MKILITKYGMKFYSRDKLTNKGGEQGETEGLLRHLVECGHDVTYFGRWEGEVPGVRFVAATLGDLDHESSAAQQQACWDADLKLLAGNYDAAIQVNGLAPTFSWIDNPRGARLQAFAVRYCGPWLNALQRLHLPRLCINNDPRSYPRDQEMSYGWEWCRPAALLDQCDARVKQVVGGKEYLRVSTYGACESFGYLPVRENRREKDIVIVAHSHFNDSLGTKGDWSLLDELFAKFPDLLVYGAGWESWAEKYPGRFPGAVSPAKVLDLVNEAKCSYVVDHHPGFKTGKPYVLTSQGCVPCWDMEAIEYAVAHYDEAIDVARRMFVPDFSFVDKMLKGEPSGGYIQR